jgi:hypothetical protein
MRGERKGDEVRENIIYLSLNFINWLKPLPNEKPFKTLEPPSRVRGL